MSTNAPYNLNAEAASRGTDADQTTTLPQIAGASERLAMAVRSFLDWHGYDNAEGLADALAEYEEAVHNEITGA